MFLLFILYSFYFCRAFILKARPVSVGFMKAGPAFTAFIVGGVDLHMLNFSLNSSLVG